MKVYRLLSEEELNLILERKTEALGNYFLKMKHNTHKYKPRERYLHFFFNKQNCEYMRKIHLKDSVGEQHFIAEFKIPLKRIIGHIGKGFYDSQYGGYDLFYDNCHEIALPISIFDPAWLKSYEKVSLESEFKNQNNQQQTNQPT